MPSGVKDLSRTYLGICLKEEMNQIEQIKLSVYFCCYRGAQTLAVIMLLVLFVTLLCFPYLHYKDVTLDKGFVFIGMGNVLFSSYFWHLVVDIYVEYYESIIATCAGYLSNAEMLGEDPDNSYHEMALHLGQKIACPTLLQSRENRSRSRRDSSQYDQAESTRFAIDGAVSAISGDSSLLGVTL
uniref:Uncharacterized protein n=1 Tax=Timema cristinae TaxID=61476 RepID=A0A7R9HBW5_TIMCR|nr:unnamed protein product [Timema cristinae]